MAFGVKLFIIATFVCNSLVNAFRTGTCDHDELEASLEHFESCFEHNGKLDICSSFDQLDVCFPRHFHKCFEKEVVDDITKNAKAVLRKAMEMILSDQQHSFGGFLAGSLFDTCENMPTHEEAEKAESRLIIWLDHAQTDNNCKQLEKNKANSDSYQCLNTEKQKIERMLRRVFAHRTNLQENVCNILSSTVGVCLRTELPECFSGREIDFIKKNMAEDFKEIFTAMEELLGNSVQFSVSECSVWSEESLFTQSSGSREIVSHYLLLLLQLLFITSRLNITI